MSTITATAQPCAKCPFRRDVPIYLRAERREEIARHIADGGTFPCHATVRWEEGEDAEEIPDESGSMICAGAIKSAALSGGSIQLARIGERLGSIDTEKIEQSGAEVWPLMDWPLLAEGAVEGAEPEEIETCSVVWDRCEAPAGWLGGGGGVVRGTIAADGECPSCGEPVCSACRHGDDGPCFNCEEPGEHDEDGWG